MLGTNDASTGRAVADYRADMEKAVDLILRQGAVCILSTIPPHPAQPELAQSYNVELRKLAKDRGLPLIDFEREILTRRKDGWYGTLIAKNDVHPTVEQGGATPHSAPTAENLQNSGWPAARLAVGPENSGGQKDSIRRPRQSSHRGPVSAAIPEGRSGQGARDARHLVRRCGGPSRRQPRRRRQAQTEIEPGNVAHRHRPRAAQWAALFSVPRFTFIWPATNRRAA